MPNPTYYIPDTFLDVCIALTSSIAALFIPLFYTVVIRLDEKYESRLIIRFFWAEKVVRWFLISTIILIASTIVYSLKFEPWFLANNFFIANSAAITAGFVLIVNVLLGIYSLREMSKYQDPERLFHHIRDSKNLTEKQRRIVRFDLLFHSLKDLNYNKDFTKTICDELDNEILTYKDKAENLPIEYFDALEQLTAIIFNSNLNNDYRQNRYVVFRLWGEVFFYKFPLDGFTYSTLWYHLSQAVEYERDKLVLKHWERAHSLIKMRGFRSREIDFFDLPIQDQKNEQNYYDEFIRFHIVLGALLLHSNRTFLLKNCLEYTSSWPPDYYLLPKGSHKIIEYFQYFNDPYDRYNMWLSWKYSFPGSSGFEQDVRIKKSINQYLVLLLFRTNAHISEKEIFNYTELNKNELNDYERALEVLYNEILSISDLTPLNQLIEQDLDDIQKLKLLEKIQTLKNQIVVHRAERKSKENMDPVKIEKFCTFIKTELTTFINQLSKIQVESNDADKISYTGFKSTVDKDFFLAESEVDYIDYEKTFASVFIQNFKHRFGFLLDQKIVLRYTTKTELIETCVDKLKEAVVIINFGIKTLEVDSRKNIINLGFVTGVTPRAYVINSKHQSSFGVKFNEIKLNENYEFGKSVIDNKIFIGIGKLSNGDLENYYADLKYNDIDLENTIGVEIGTSMSFKIPEMLKCVCLIEHQPYRESKDPDMIIMEDLKSSLDIL